MLKFSDSLPMILLRAREAVMVQFTPVFKANGITEQQWRVLRALQEMKESNAQDLAKASDILSPSLSRIFITLEAKNLIVREIPPEDQRAYKLKLSAKGDRFCKEVGQSIDQVYDQIKDQICPEKYTLLYDLLHELTSLCGKHSGK